MDSQRLWLWVEFYRRMGWRLFPARGKRPLIRDWPNRATTDREQLREWFGRGDVNVAAVCEGFGVFDIEREHLDKIEGRLPETAICFTGGGGLHIYVKPLGRTARLMAGGVHIGEYKGIGSAVTLPPSQTDDQYRWFWPPIEIAEAPEWLRRLIPPPPKIRRFSPSVYHASDGIAKLRALEKAVATCPPGNRNAILYWAAKKAKEDGIPDRYFLPVLEQAALAAGLPHREIVATLRSALR